MAGPEQQNVSEETLQKFWKDLKQFLKKDEFGMDLDSNYDRCRIRITSCEENTFSNTDANLDFRGLNVSVKYPFLPKDFNPDSTTNVIDEITEIVSEPNTEKLRNLYNAAVEGNLHISTLQEKGGIPRQIILNGKGEVDVLPLYTKATEEMKKATPCVFEPSKPKMKTAGFLNRFLAFFGNSKAKDACKSVDDENAKLTRDYNKLKKAYDEAQKMDQRFVTQCRNQKFAFKNRFIEHDNSFKSAESTYIRYISRVHSSKVIDNIKDSLNSSIKKSEDKITEIAKSGKIAEHKDELKKQIAIWVTHKAEQSNLPNAFWEYPITEQNTKEFSDRFSLLDSFAEMVSKHPKFSDQLNNLDDKMLNRFANDPKKTLEKLYDWGLKNYWDLDSKAYMKSLTENQMENQKGNSEPTKPENQKTNEEEQLNFVP